MLHVLFFFFLFSNAERPSRSEAGGAFFPGGGREGEGEEEGHGASRINI